jgi:HSP20 family protein
MLRNAIVNNPLGVAREMDRLFDSMMSSQPFGFVPTIRSQWAYPAINVWEDQDHLYAEAELPGLKMEDIEVLVTDDQLTVRGNRTVDVPDTARALRRERAVGEFERTVGLPVPIDTEGVEARLTDGVLTITLPKAAAVKPRKIEVKSLSASS